MRTFSKFLLISSLLLYFALAQSVSAQSLKEIQAYCQSMSGSGVSEEDSKAFIADCIAEQSSYLDQDSAPVSAEEFDDSASYEENNHYQDSYQESPYEQEDYNREQNCYAKVDEQIQTLLDNDSNADFDYDQLLDKCLNGGL